jgi:hypothetical protein
MAVAATSVRARSVHGAFLRRHDLLCSRAKRDAREGRSRPEVILLGEPDFDNCKYSKYFIWILQSLGSSRVEAIEVGVSRLDRRQLFHGFE